MMLLTIITVLFQFTGFAYVIGGIRLDAFSITVPFMCVLLVLQVMARRTIRIPVGFVFLLPFLLIHILSAMTVSSGNGMREGLQMAVVVAFLLAICNIKDPCPRGWHWRLLVLGTWALLFYNVGWHINEGHWSGWKRLNDLKHTFSFASFFTAIWLVQRNFRASAMLIAVFGLLGGIILISGERKAMLVYAITFVSMLSVLNARTALAMLAVPVFVGALSLSLFMDDYVARQIDSLFFAPAYTPAGTPTSMSNEQRVFAFETGLAFFAESPIVGIGTNSYQDIVARLFPFHPHYLRAGIHGDFFRVLVENGLVGFVAYISVWILGVVRTWRYASGLRSSDPNSAGFGLRKRYLFVSFIFLVVAVSMCGLEATGTESMVLLGLVSLWPDLSRIAMKRTLSPGARKAESRTLEVTP